MIKYHWDIQQGTDEWHALRRGIMCASEAGLLVTPTGKKANNEKLRTHLYELAAQRITKYTEPSYISDDMLRGTMMESVARDLYSEQVAPVKECGFITNDGLGFTLGYSPDGLVGDNGLIEIKSRRQKFQLQTILDWVVPDDYVFQVQSGLLASGREWCDYLSYHGGMGMPVIRAYPDPEIQAALIEAGQEAEDKILQIMLDHDLVWSDRSKYIIATERLVEARDEIII